MPDDDISPLLRQAATVDGLTPDFCPLSQIAAAEGMGLIRRRGMEPIWRIMPLGNRYLAHIDEG